MQPPDASKDRLVWSAFAIFSRGQSSAAGQDPGPHPDAADGERRSCHGHDDVDVSRQRRVAQRVVVVRRRRPAVDVVSVAQQLRRRVAVRRRFTDADVDDDGKFDAVAPGSRFFVATI